MKLSTTGVVMRRDNVDTDQIIPARYLTTVSRDGLGKGLFAVWRYLPDGSLDPQFSINQPHFAGAQILLAGPNFGSGSSREHAVWALMEFGFLVVIASSFADIFATNSLKNGLLPIVLPEADVRALMDAVDGVPSTRFHVELRSQTVTVGERTFAFAIDPFRKACLLEGLDDLGYLLQRLPAIEAFEAAR